MPAELSLSSIAHFRVTSYDLERATAFYRDVLRMPILYEFPGFAVFDCGTCLGAHAFELLRPQPHAVRLRASMG